MIRYISQGMQGDNAKYRVYDSTGQNVYDLDVVLHKHGKMIRLLEINGEEQGFVHLSMLERDTSIWIGLHGKLIGTVCLKRDGKELCISIPQCTIEGEPLEGEFKVLKNGEISVTVTSWEKNGIPYEKLDIADDRTEHFVLLMVLAVEEAVIERKNNTAMNA